MTCDLWSILVHFQYTVVGFITSAVSLPVGKRSSTNTAALLCFCSVRLYYVHVNILAVDQLFRLLDSDEKVTKRYYYVGVTEFLKSKYSDWLLAEWCASCHWG